MSRRIAVIDHFDALADRQTKEFLPAGFTLDKVDAADPEAQLRAAAEADYIIVSGVWLRAPVIEATRHVRLIQKLGAGVDKIDLAAASRRGIPVAITADENSSSVGEATLLLMLAFSRRLTDADAAVRAGRWPKLEIAARSFELLGRTLGIVGLGRTGRQVARRARAFEMNIVYFDIVRPPPEVEAALGARFVLLDELLATSDFVTLHVPWTVETHHLIDAAALARMRSDAVLINTSRGEVIDEAALDRALRAGGIAGAGLDVFESEPVTAPRPVFESSNVVLMPHVAGVTTDSLARMWRHAYRNCQILDSGGAIAAEDLVDTQALRSR